MKLPPFVPKELRQLAEFVPLRGWDAIEWLPLMRSLRKLSYRFVTRSGVKPLASRLESTVDGLVVSPSIPADQALTQLSCAAARQQAGDTLLRLYFAQWREESGLLVDLRPSRLGFAEDHLMFAPSGLWIRLDRSFREGMVALYQSFYSDDDAQFEAALKQMGMIADHLSPAEADELKALLRAHFGADQSAQRFSIDAFRKSFDELFEFFLAHDYTLSPDFVFVGFYLITLYLSLEAGGQAHDVRQISREVLGAEGP